MLVPDVNVLLNVQLTTQAHHDRAVDWLRHGSEGDEEIGIANLVLSAVVRILTSTGVSPTPLAPADAFTFCDYVLKLRTMVDGAEHMGAGLAVDEGDSRITRSGALLRRTSVDELPNLLNVLRGEMAIVGPRPTVPSQVAAYTERQRGRLAVKPGITGWAQVNGRASLPWAERIELDLWWIEHRSWRLDLEILRRTAWTVLHGGGTYRGDRGGWRDGS